MEPLPTAVVLAHLNRQTARVTESDVRDSGRVSSRYRYIVVADERMAENAANSRTLVERSTAGGNRGKPSTEHCGR